MGLLDWLDDLRSSGGPTLGGAMGEAGDTSSMSMPPPASPPMPPVQMTGQNAPPIPPPQVSSNMDPMTAGGVNDSSSMDPMLAGSGPPPAQPPVPVPQPRPPGAAMAQAPGAPLPTSPVGPPMPLGPGLGVGAPPNVGNMPGQTWLGRAFGITPDQAGLQGRQVGAGLAAGLKSVGENYNKPGLAAFAGSAGAAMEGGNKESQTQQKQVTDYLNAAIKAKQQGDEAGYKQNYLRYLAAKLKADTDKAASSNKNDTPTQLYLSAQRLVQPDRNAMNKQLEQMRKDGADPAEIAKKQAELETAISAKLTGHYATLGIHPQDAATLAKQPGNAQENPIDAGKMGITKDNIGQKLQPGQYYINPADKKVYQYKGAPKKEATKGVPDKPTSPEPPDPMHPYKTPLDAGSSSNDDED